MPTPGAHEPHRPHRTGPRLALGLIQGLINLIDLIDMGAPPAQGLLHGLIDLIELIDFIDLIALGPA